MVCGCKNCGTLMVQEQKGITCRCVCPACGDSCDMCIGFERPLSKAELQQLFISGGPQFTQDEDE